MAASELESVVLPRQLGLDRSCKRTSHFRFFLGFSTIWLVVLVVLLRNDPNPWVIAPLGLGLAALSVCAWLIHRNLVLEENSDPSKASRTRSSGATEKPRRDGFGGCYLTIGVAYLYLGSLSLFHGTLPGWPVPPKPDEPTSAKAANPGLPPTPAYNLHPSATYPANYPGGNFMPSMTPPPGAYPRPGVTYPQNGMSMRPAGMTPPPRPYGTPPPARPLPPNYPPGTMPGAATPSAIPSTGFPPAQSPVNQTQPPQPAATPLLSPPSSPAPAYATPVPAATSPKPASGNRTPSKGPSGR